MLDLTNKMLAEIFKSDMQRGVPGELITYYIEEELIPYDVFMEGDFPEDIDYNFPKFQYRLWLN